MQGFLDMLHTLCTFYNAPQAQKRPHALETLLVTKTRWGTYVTQVVSTAKVLNPASLR